MKMRLDQLLVNHNLAPSRENAKAMILANNVLVNNVPALKAGELVDVDSLITLRGEPLKYVSRAGEKLAKGLEAFQINVDNLICLDIGSSTGGFTDCLLQNNAKKVYAVDVGTNQLAWKLRNNPQVVSLEKTNFRYVTKQLFEPDQIEFACCDVSFISLDKIIPPLKDILLLDHYAFFLIKPQFESTRETVHKGKINSKEAHQRVIEKVINLALTNGFSIINLDYSPILGNKKKNIEFICLLQRTTTPVNHLSDCKIMEIVENAWNSSLILSKTLDEIKKIINMTIWKLILCKIMILL